MAKLIKSDGSESVINPKNNSDFRLEELNGYVNGYIEIINIKNEKIMVVNEEGAIIGLPVNKKASLIYGSTIFGDVVICKRTEVL